MQDPPSAGCFGVEAIRHSRMVARIALAALVLIAGRKLTKYFPQRFFARRGWKVYPRKSNLTDSNFPGRSSSLQYTIRGLPGMSSETALQESIVLASSTSRACRSLLQWTMASSA